MKNSKMVIRDNYYYKYICLWDNETQRKKQIPFKLAHIDEYEIALYRKGVVERRAKQLKRDKQQHLLIGYKFDWESESGREETKPALTLQEGADIYLSKMVKLRRESTMEMNLLALNHWIDFLEPNKICSEITSKDLLGYVIKNKGDRSDTSLNMDLRVLRTMLYYCRDIEDVVLKKNLSFKLALKEAPINDKDPIYISEVEFQEIMNEDWCLLYTKKREWFKEVFQLYWDLGVRLAEPFRSPIVGKKLFIPKEVAKNGVARKVPLNPQQIRTITEMQERYAAKPTKDFIKYYSKVFKKALRHCGIDEEKTFKSLRHSYGIRRRIETNGNILMIQEEMGHRVVESTMQYQRCKNEDLIDDFPSYKKVLEGLDSKAKNLTSTSNTSTSKEYGSYPNSRAIS